jgi:hypothetical protein
VGAVGGLGLHWQRAELLSRPHLGNGAALLSKIVIMFGQRDGACGGQAQ